VQSTSCGPIVRGTHAPSFLIVSDLPLRAPPGARLEVEGIRWELQRANFRAGRFTVGYESCDDSTAAAGHYDTARCAANMKSIAATKSVLVVIGPYNSGCAQEEIPIANTAPGGPLAMIGTATTDPELTTAVPGGQIGSPARYYPTHVRSFVRLAAPDQFLAAAAVLVARAHRLHRVAVLDDGEPAGQNLAAWFRDRAAQFGVRVVSTGTWSQRATHYTQLVRKVAGARPDGVYFAGYPFLHGGEVLRELRRALGNRFLAFGPDGWADPQEDRHDAGSAANGFLTTLAGVPTRDLGPQGQALLRRFGPEPVEQYGSAYGAAAAAVALQAIAASDGTRRTVTRSLFHARTPKGLLGSFTFDADGDPTVGAVGVLRVENGNVSLERTLRPTSGFAKSSTAR
jgi:branched-chain amino acid transport system substrate-binding protein